VSRTIYLVTGMTGEYSDHSEWPVAAYEQEADAKACVERLAAWCDERQCGENSRLYCRDVDGSPPDDPDFHLDRLTGTKYTYDPIELRGAQ